MKNKIANYTVVIEKEFRSGTKKVAYSAYVPALGIGTDADTLKEVKTAIKKMVDFHIECLIEEGEEIKIQNSPSIITTLRTLLPKNTLVASN